MQGCKEDKGTRRGGDREPHGLQIFDHTEGLLVSWSPGHPDSEGSPAPLLLCSLALALVYTLNSAGWMYSQSSPARYFWATSSTLIAYWNA